ncbi:penicillin-binding protein 1A [Acetohalobium arabaticum]|uniref:Penicillin-binding protein 1A n=1 Tax=Acetohalobium arabaticum (strain ATCC 49924 / DSM 5501 / Z-7288) TaxID=574087 RepID=D9QUP3_ACEAZ|nr:PBP1A family penicillin-binding protein [Acetohalobium arabaticum]ADL11952.1 penicillin-binding protein, 1A family [Acetohalobium arabaticum DSM 5501]
MSRFKKVSIISIILLFAILSGALIGSVAWIVNETPDISNYGRWKPSESTTIYSEDNKLLSRLYQENRVYAPIDRMPQNLQNAIVAIEDNRFYEHYGVDPWAIGRALWVDIKGGGIIQGGSTLTQQLAKNALLTHERTLYRKIQEAYLAIQFERMYTKEEILEFYLNEIYLGHSVYGVQTAAEFYFDKDVENLTLPEAALLAGLPKAPNKYSPYKNKQKAKVRRNLVLEQMKKYGYITESQAEKAKNQPIKTENGLERKEDKAPYFVRHIRKKLIDMYGAQAVYNSGLKVYTTLDYEMQTKAEETVKEAFKDYIPSVNKKEGKGRLQPQIALTTINPQNGHIKTMIGGRGEEEDRYNRVTQAYRQPGSAFKPFVYTAAVEQGYSPASVIDDTPEAYQVGSSSEDKWIPQNYNDEYLGPTTLRIGLAKSINVMAVKLLDKVGIDNTIEVAKKMGIKNIVETGAKNDKNLALALGGLTKGVTPLEMASSYGVLANEGVRVEPISLLKVVDNRGNVIYENDSNKKIVLDKDVTYIVNDMLESVLARGPIVWGTGWRANLGRPAAGKTGTTSNYTDAWFVGYTPDLVTSIWIGEDAPSKMKYKIKNEEKLLSANENEAKPNTNTISSAETARLWSEYMRKIIKNKPVTEFSTTDNIVSKKICIESSKLPSKDCPENTIREEIFIKGTEPTEECELHQPTTEVKVDTSTGKLATDYCPPEKVRTYTYQQETHIKVDENGVPIKKVDEETKVPLRDDEGNYIYERMPEEKCEAHRPDSLQDKIKNQTDKIKEKFEEFFDISN